MIDNGSIPPPPQGPMCNSNSPSSCMITEGLEDPSPLISPISLTVDPIQNEIRGIRHKLQELMARIDNLERLHKQKTLKQKAQPPSYTPIGMPYARAFEILQSQGKITSVGPTPYPLKEEEGPSRNQSAYCKYHQKFGHTIEDCEELKQAVQRILDDEKPPVTFTPFTASLPNTTITLSSPNLPITSPLPIMPTHHLPASSTTTSVQTKSTILPPQKQTTKKEPKISKRQFTTLTTSYTHALKILQAKGLISLLEPTPDLPVYKRGEQWNPNAYCNLHQSKGHDTEQCIKLKYLVQDLVNNGTLNHSGLILGPKTTPPKQEALRKPHLIFKQHKA